MAQHLAKAKTKHPNSQSRVVCSVDDLLDELYRQLSDLDRKLEALDRKA